MKEKKIIFFLLFTLHSMIIGKVLIFGHRGASYSAPENTLSAIEKAFELGADGVEVDIQLTADKKIIVLHDDTLKRVATYTPELREKMGMTKKQFEAIICTPISELSYEDIKHIDIGLWKDKKWAGEYIPTLDRVLHFVLTQKNPKKIQIEVKGNNYTIIPELKKSLAQCPKNIITNSVILIGFDLKTMSLAKQEIPFCQALLIRSQSQLPSLHDVYTCIEKIICAKLDGITFEANPKLVTKEIVQKIHLKQKNVGVWVYTEQQDTPKNFRYFAELGIDFETTNLPPGVMCK